MRVRGRSAKIENCDNDPRVNRNVSVSCIKLTENIYQLHFITLHFPHILHLALNAWIVMRVVVFGLVTPLDHPPETTQWVTAWVGDIIYIIYIERAMRCQGKVVEWGSRDQKQPLLSRSSRKPAQIGDE